MEIRAERVKRRHFFPILTVKKYERSEMRNENSETVWLNHKTSKERMEETSILIFATISLLLYPS